MMITFDFGQMSGDEAAQQWRRRQNDITQGLLNINREQTYQNEVMPYQNNYEQAFYKANTLNQQNMADIYGNKDYQDAQRRAAITGQQLDLANNQYNMSDIDYKNQANNITRPIALEGLNRSANDQRDRWTNADLASEQVKLGQAISDLQVNMANTPKFEDKQAMFTKQFGDNYVLEQTQNGDLLVLNKRTGDRTKVADFFSHAQTVAQFNANKFQQRSMSQEQLAAQQKADQEQQNTNIRYALDFTKTYALAAGRGGGKNAATNYFTELAVMGGLGQDEAYNFATNYLSQNPDAGTTLNVANPKDVSAEKLMDVSNQFLHSLELKQGSKLNLPTYTVTSGTDNRVYTTDGIPKVNENGEYITTAPAQDGQAQAQGGQTAQGGQVPTQDTQQPAQGKQTQVNQPVILNDKPEDIATPTNTQMTTPSLSPEQLGSLAPVLGGQINSYKALANSHGGSNPNTQDNLNALNTKLDHITGGFLSPDIKGVVADTKRVIFPTDLEVKLGKDQANAIKADVGKQILDMRVLTGQRGQTLDAIDTSDTQYRQIQNTVDLKYKKLNDLFSPDSGLPTDVAINKSLQLLDDIQQATLDAAANRDRRNALTANLDKLNDRLKTSGKLLEGDMRNNGLIIKDTVNDKSE